MKNNNTQTKNEYNKTLWERIFGRHELGLCEVLYVY